jgi:YD repeat-containing protein
MMRNPTALIVLGSLFVSAVAVAAETLSYRYDARGRLVKVERSGGPKSGAITNYSYDKANNRTNKNVSGAP